MVLEILAHRVAVLVLKHAEVRHHRHHRFGVVSRARHQLQAVAIGLDLVFAGNLGHQPRLGEAAELVEDRREHRRDPEKKVQNFRFRVARKDVAPFDVAGLVAEDACQLVVGLDEVDQALVDVDESAHRRKGVDLAVVDDFDRVGNVLTRDLIPEVTGDAGDVGVEQRIGLDHAAGDDLLILGLAQSNFGLR